MDADTGLVSVSCVTTETRPESRFHVDSISLAGSLHRGPIHYSFHLAFFSFLFFSFHLFFCSSVLTAFHFPTH